MKGVSLCMSQRYLADDNNRQEEVERDEGEEKQRVRGTEKHFYQPAQQITLTRGCCQEWLGCCFIDCLAAGSGRDRRSGCPLTSNSHNPAELLPLSALQAGGFEKKQTWVITKIKSIHISTPCTLGKMLERLAYISLVKEFDLPTSSADRQPVTDGLSNLLPFSKQFLRSSEQMVQTIFCHVTKNLTGLKNKIVYSKDCVVFIVFVMVSLSASGTEIFASWQI